jgi:hypothetical protein
MSWAHQHDLVLTDSADNPFCRQCAQAQDPTYEVTRALWLALVGARARVVAHVNSGRRLRGQAVIP